MTGTSVFRLVFAVLLVGLAGGIVWLWTPDRPRAWLEAKYLRAPSDLMEVGGVRLHVRDTGRRDGPALLMMHGFGSSLHTWEAWAVALGDGFRIIRFDAAGSGLSGPDPTGDYSDRRSMQLVGALLDTLGVRSATLIGNSMGGRIAWSFAAAHPDRVDKLVLLAPDGFASPGLEYGKPPEVPAALRLMRFVLPKPLLKMSLVPAYADPNRLTDDVVNRYYDLMLAPGTRTAVLHRMEQLVLTDPRPRLASIEAPTLLVWGEKDGMIPVDNARDYLSAIAGSRLVTFPHLGHVPHEEEPEASLVPVRAFLEERAKSASAPLERAGHHERGGGASSSPPS